MANRWHRGYEVVTTFGLEITGPLASIPADFVTAMSNAERIVTAIAILTIAGVISAEPEPADPAPPIAEGIPVEASLEGETSGNAVQSKRVMDAPSVAAQPHDQISKGAWRAAVAVGGSFDVTDLGTEDSHYLASTSLQLSYAITNPVAERHWFRGFWEASGELIVDCQVAHESAYLAGLTPLLRYNFLSHSRIIPYIEGGIGAAITDIGLPDLSTKFEFIDQIGIGSRFLLNQHWSLLVQARYMHISNGGIKEPNGGINLCRVQAGFSWGF